MKEMNLEIIHVMKLLSQLEMMYGASFERNCLPKNIPDRSVIAKFWLDTLKPYPWCIVERVLDKLKVPNSKFSKYPPNLIEISNECFKLFNILNIDDARNYFLSTYGARQNQIRAKLDQIDHRNKGEINCAMVQGREPNLIILTSDEIDLIRRTEPTIQYKDQYVSYLVNKFCEIEIFGDFDKLYKENLTNFINSRCKQ